MSQTKAIIINQTDQLLSSPTVENSIILRTLPTDPSISLTFTPAPASDRLVNFPDPGIPSDFVVYGNAVQTLTNKTITDLILDGQPTITDFTNAQHTHANATQGGQFDHANLLLLNADDHSQYALLAGRLGGQTLTGGTGASDPLTLRSTINITKGGILIDEDDLTLGSGLDIIVSGSGELTGLPATPSGATAAASKAYVDAQIAIVTGSSGVWKEDLISAVQLDNSNNAISQATAFYWNVLPIIGDTFVLKDGSNTETYTYAGISGAFTPVPGVSATTALNNLAANITANSSYWTATVFTTLQSINTSVMVITRLVPNTPVLDRIYGVTATPNIGKYVNYGAELDYRSSTIVNLPSSDPGAARFGISRVTASLLPDETHMVRAEDDIYLWNNDAGTWQLTSAEVVLATSGSGGGIIGQTTFDSDLGLETTAGVTSVKVDNSTVQFDGGGNLIATSSAVPDATSASGGGVVGKVSADEDYGLTIVGNDLRVTPDNSTIILVGGLLTATGGGAVEEYINDGKFGNISGGVGTLNGDTIYPTFGVGTNDFETLFSLACTTGSGRIDCSFQGRLSSFRTTVMSVKINVLNISGSPSMTLSIYFEGSGTAVYTSVITPTGTLTEYNVDTSGFTQPTGQGRFIVVAEGHFSGVGSFGVSTPFVRME